MAEFIYQMYQARKAHGDKVILDDVTLSFYPGAKIGVVGSQRYGQVDPAQDHGRYRGGLQRRCQAHSRLHRGHPAAGAAARRRQDRHRERAHGVWRYDRQGRSLQQDRRGDVRPGLRHGRLMAEMGKLQDEIDAADGWDIDSKLGQAMDALQLPDSDMPVSVLSGGERRRVACASCCSRLPTCCCSTSHEPPGRRVDPVARALPAQLPGAVLAVTHDRYFLDNVAEWICEVDRGHLYPYKGNYSTYLETKAARIEAQATATPSSPSAWRPSSSGCAARPRPVRPRTRPVWLATRRWRPRPAQAEARLDRHPHPCGSASGQQGARGPSPAQGVRRSRAHR